MFSPSFGRRKSIDPRDKTYPLRSMIQLAPTEPLRTRPWNAPPALDQGHTGVPGRDNEGSCTGFGGAHFLAAAPHQHQLSAEFALELYDAARKNDEWPGENYDGSSVRGLMKAMQSLGYIAGGYLWAWDASTVRDYTLRYSPVVTGSDWYAEMMEPDRSGFIRPVGPLEGGHCYVVLGYSADRDAFRIQNSWGVEWGQKGRAWMAFEDYQFLISQDGGEAASAVEVVASSRAS
jgi:hypothetical protein